MSSIPSWPGPKAAVLRGADEAIYGLSFEDGTAVYLGDMAGEIPPMPPWDRELAMVGSDGVLVLTSGRARGQEFVITPSDTRRAQGEGE